MTVKVCDSIVNSAGQTRPMALTSRKRWVLFAATLKKASGDLVVSLVIGCWEKVIFFLLKKNSNLQKKIIYIHELSFPINKKTFCRRSNGVIWYTGIHAEKNIVISR